VATVIVLLVLAGGLGAWRVAAQANATPTVAITVSTDVPAFTPRLVLAKPGQQISFTNHMNSTVELDTTRHAPQVERFSVPSGGTVQFSLARPGLYHFYDAASAHVIAYVGENDVVNALPGAPNANLPSQGWMYVPDPQGVPLNSFIHVPTGNDLLAVPAAVVQVGGSVSFHNQDTDAHNLVTDPADPAGVAFELLGTDGEPSIHGAIRRITFTAPGLYHIYCSIHTMVMGQVGGYQVVMPRDSSASGYTDRNPMEAWVLAVQ
jgi:plastocyanin